MRGVSVASFEDETKINFKTKCGLDSTRSAVGLSKITIMPFPCKQGKCID